jgi:hypothetical protein
MNNRSNRVRIRARSRVRQIQNLAGVIDDIATASGNCEDPDSYDDFMEALIEAYESDPLPLVESILLQVKLYYDYKQQYLLSPPKKKRKKT